MNIIKALEEPYLTSEILNTPCFMIPQKGFKSNLIHFNAYCSKVRNEEFYYYNKIYKSFDAHIFTDFKFISLNFVKENKEKYCFSCFSEALAISNVPLGGGVTSVGIFLQKFKNLNSFFNTKSGKLDEAADSLDFIDILKSAKNMENLAAVYREKITVKLNECESSYPKNPKSLKSFHEDLAEFIADSKHNEVDSSGSFLPEQKSETIKLLTNSNESVIFSTFNIKRSNILYWSASYDKKLRNLILKILLNSDFIFGEFAVLPYLEFKFLEKFVYAPSPYLDKHALESKHVVVSEFPSVEVFETFKALYDESNETLNVYANVLEAAKTI